jgi:hypothetical protein
MPGLVEVVGSDPSLVPEPPVGSVLPVSPVVRDVLDEAVFVPAVVPAVPLLSSPVRKTTAATIKAMTASAENARTIRRRATVRLRLDDE